MVVISKCFSDVFRFWSFFLFLIRNRKGGVIRSFGFEEVMTSERG